jgi:uncharacterized protein YjiK
VPLSKLHKTLTYWLIPAMLILVFSLMVSSMALAQGEPAYARHVRAIETGDLGIPHPAGLAFSPGANTFYVVEARSSVEPQPPDTYLVEITPYEAQGASARILAAIQDPINMAFDGLANRLLILQPESNRLIDVPQGPDGSLDPAALVRLDARHFGLQNPQGMAVDPVSGHLLILDAARPRIVRVEPNLNGGFEGAVISEIDLGQTGLTDVRGLALDPVSGHFHLLDPGGQKLLELTETGEIVTTRDLSEFGLVEPQGLVFAPSGDLTDDPAQMSLYIADSGLVDQRTQASGPVESGQDAHAGLEAQKGLGNITEFSFTEFPASGSADFVANLVRTIDTATYDPPSPDPSGLAYLPSRNTLLMCDGEVEETISEITHFAGANVWETTLGGNVVNTANISKKAPTVVPMTNEPTGVAWNPANGHFYFSDDDSRMVYDLNPGSDGQPGTADDTWTSFGTQSVGSEDPEGIAYDNWHNRLFVADGVNREIYEFTLSGSLVGQFDVQTYGITDPETVEFNSANGTLFILSSDSKSPLAVETTTSGILLQTIDISAANPIAAAGLAYAPASDGSGAMRFYIVDRGIDNDSDPDIIDGKMYVLTAPPIGSIPPFANDDSPSTVVNTPVALDVAANDFDLNGNLDPATANTNCTTCENPANGTLVNNGDGSFTYTPDLDYLGSDGFVYEICDTEPLCDTASVSITVIPPGSILINGGATYATSTSVQLTLSAGGSGVDKMRFSNNGSTWSTWEPYASSKSWTLPSGDGIKTVYFQYRDQAGNVSPSYSDSIILDTAAPTGSILIGGGAAYATSTSTTLTMSADDSGTGVSEMRFSNNGSTWSPWEPYSSSRAWAVPPGDGTKTVYVRYRDNAGNTSPTYSDSIVLDTAAPTGSISINGGDTYATSTSTALSLSANDGTAGVDDMRFSNNGTSWSGWEAYAGSKAWTLPSGDGSKTVYVQYRDRAGNISSSYSDSIILDTAAPTGSILVDGGAAYAASTSVDLMLLASDGTSGVDEMRLSNSGTSWSGWEAYAGSRAWTLPLGDGSKTVYVQYRDRAGNVSPSYSDSIILDTAAPTGSILIDGGATYAASTSVLLSLSASDAGSGVDGMHFSNNGAPWSAWEPYSGSRAWTLPSGDGSKTVYVQYRDNAGQISSTYSDSITLDTAAPTGSILIDGGAAYATSNVVELTLSANDSDSGVSEMRFSNNGSTWSTWEPYSSSRAWTVPPGDGTKTVYARYRDNAGNTSSTYSDDIILDTMAPTGSILIDGGTVYATSTSVELTLSASDSGSGVDEMRLSNDGSTWSTWEPYSGSKSWTLPSGDGSKTVYVQYRDQATHVSPSYSDSIILDTAAPIGSILIDGGATYAASTSVLLSLSASDAGSGLDGMHFSDDGSAWSGWEAYAGSKAWTLPSGDGSKTVYVQVRDHLDQVSSVYSDSITLDTTPPSSNATSPASTIHDPLVVSWSGTDNLSGIATYDVQYRVSGSDSWSSWLSEVSESSAVFEPASPGQTYYFQVRARDKAGNLEAYPGGDGDTSTFVQKVFLFYLPFVLDGF